MALARYLPSTLAAVMFALATNATYSQLVESMPDVGKSLERELRGGETHEFRLAINTNELIYITVLQKGIDVTLSLVGPDGKNIVKVDSPNGTAGFEPLWTIADKAGEYALKIKSEDNKARSGRYEISYHERRPAREADQPFVLGMNSINEGMALLGAGGDSRKEAEAQFESAGKFFQSIDDNERKGRGFFRLADSFSSIRSANRAIHFFKLSIPPLEESGNLADAGRAYFYLGGRLSADVDEGVTFSKSAVRLAHEAKDDDLEADSQLQIGNWRNSVGDIPEALHGYQAALSISLRQNNSGRASVAMGNISSVYRKLGDYRASLNYQLDSIDAWEKVSPSPRALSLMTLGAMYGEMGNYELSREYSEKAAAQFTRAGDKTAAAISVANIGETYIDEGDAKTALSYFEEALKRMDEMKRYSPSIYCHLARAHLLIGSAEIAYKFATQCLEYNRNLRDRYNEAKTLIQIGELEIRRDQPLKTFEVADQAEKIAEKYVYPTIENSALSLKALALSKLRRSAEAKEAAERAIRSIESLRMNLINDSGQLNFLSSSFLPFHLLIESEVRSSNDLKAWSVAEQMKARLLLDVLGRQPSTATKREGISERHVEDELRKEMNTLNRRLRIELDRPSRNEAVIVELQRTQEERRLRMDDLITQKYARHPELRLSAGEMKTISDIEVERLLKNTSSAIVEFVVAQEKTVVFMLGKGASGQIDVRSAIIERTDKELDATIAAYRAKLADGNLDFPTRSKELYNLLLKPVLREFHDSADLIIVPDGPLWDLPFQALMDEKGKYLVEKAAISYAPSLTALREMSRKANTRKAGPDAELIAFGNPIVDTQTKERVQRVFMSEKLEPLPEAERLVKELGRMYGPNRSKVFTGVAAREEVAKSQVPKYRIVQFATHGILNNVSPMYSHLVLSQDAKNPNEDGLLEAWELKDLDLKADMVILSACDTARGKVSGGEGIIGMTWASFIAGSPTTVASQWKVESSSTTEFMLEFHRQLLAKKRVSKAEAMRRAALKLMKDPKYRHPSYWGAWVLVGDGS